MMLQKGGSMQAIALKPVERIEIVTLLDNYIDMLDMMGSEVVHRAAILKDGKIGGSIVAEHGFSALVRVYSAEGMQSLLFDFGFSPWGVKHNMETLEIDPQKIAVSVLSHGHMDHFGGMEQVAKILGRRIDLVLHPAAFRQGRHFKFGELKVYMPGLAREDVEGWFHVMETKAPLALLGGHAAFLGEIPKVTPFEQGIPYAFYEEDGAEKKDNIEDDSALVLHLRDKGLVVLTGCAHSGVINTLLHARKTTSMEQVHMVMGGFHLAGPMFDPVIAPTIAALKEFAAAYVIPTHCSGRKAISIMESDMPGFLLNMSGTKMIFTA